MSYESELRRMLIERTRTDIERMRHALITGQRELIRQLGHRLCGAAGALELPRLSSLGARLEREGLTGDAGSVTDLLAQLQEALRQAARAQHGTAKGAA